MKNIILLLFLSTSFVTLSQNRDSLAFEVLEERFEVKYKKVESDFAFDTIQNKNFPIYYVNEINFLKLKSISEVLKSFNGRIVHSDTINILCDSILVQKDEVISLQKERVELYKSSYDQLKDINSEYSKQLESAIDLGRKSARRSKFNSVLYGILGGTVTGMTLGVILTQ